MPTLLCTKTDFQAHPYYIADSVSAYRGADVTTVINRWESYYIRKLLGAVMGDAMIAYISNNYNPANTNLNKILNAFNEDDTQCGQIRMSRGLKQLLLACIYLEWWKDNASMSTQAGVVRPNTEVASNSSAADTIRYAEKRYNDLLDTAEAIQWLVRKYKNLDDYKNYNGEVFGVAHSNYF